MDFGCQRLSETHAVRGICMIVGAYPHYHPSAITTFRNHEGDDYDNDEDDDNDDEADGGGGGDDDGDDVDDDDDDDDDDYDD